MTREAVLHRARVPAVAGGALLLGFAVAQTTGQRWLGGVILLAGGIYCAATMLPTRGVARTAVLAVVFIASFVFSHPLGLLIGTWPAVLLASAVTFAVGYALMGPTGSRVSTASPPLDSTR